MDAIGCIKRDGFAICPDVISAPETKLLAETLASPTVARSKAGARHILKHQPVADLAFDPRLLRLACQVLGQGASPFRVTLFDKSPHTNWLVVWHQDTALPLLSRVETPGWGSWSIKEGVHYAHAPASVLMSVLALRFHLDDSTEHNGPLRVLPGTHTKGLLSDDEIISLAGYIKPVDCLVKSGGVVAMRPLIVHASSKSSTTEPRRVLHIEYATSRNVGPGLELATC